MMLEDIRLTMHGERENSFTKMEFCLFLHKKKHMLLVLIRIASPRRFQ